MNHNTYRQIVSGQDPRFRIRVLQVLLRLAALIYECIVRVRNLLYTARILPAHKAGVPVISVGNLTTGGTGKTPLVIWLCNYLRAKGLHCSILTRGYKASPEQITDEPALLAKACLDTDVIVNPNRIAGARKAVSVCQSQALVLDDGFQHRKLKRDLDIVAVDATCPFGYGRMLPAGLLREPKRSLARANAVIITRYDQIAEDQIARLEEEIRKIAPDIAIAKAAHKHTAAITFQNEKLPLEELRNKKIFAFCGIGNPNAFFRCLEQNHLLLVGTQIFDDHHAYTPNEMKHLFERACSCQAQMIVCTQKDWVKTALLSPEKEDITFAYLAMELDFLEGIDKITSLIDGLFSEEAKENKAQTYEL